MFRVFVKSMTRRRPPWRPRAFISKARGMMVPWRCWGWPSAIAVVSVWAEFAHWTPTLRYERSVMVTEPWRLFTAHLVHLGWAHLLLNLCALFMLSALLAQRIRPTQWVRWWLVSSVAVSSGLYYLDSGLTVYVGASGVLHGLAAAAAVSCLRHGCLEAGWLLGGLILKLGGNSGVARHPV